MEKSLHSSQEHMLHEKRKEHQLSKHQNELVCLEATFHAVGLRL